MPAGSLARKPLALRSTASPGLPTALGQFLEVRKGLGDSGYLITNLKNWRSWVLFPPGAGLFQFLTIESLIGAARLICQNQKCAAWGKTSANAQIWQEIM